MWSKKIRIGKKKTKERFVLGKKSTKEKKKYKIRFGGKKKDLVLEKKKSEKES